MIVREARLSAATDSAAEQLSALQVAAAVVLAALVAVGTFPGPPVQVIPTLDGSWLYEINRLPGSSWEFGRDASFTYGPLGFVLYPADFGDNLVIAAAFRFATQVLFAVLVLGAALRARTIPRQVALALAALAAPTVGMAYEYQLLLVAVLLAARASSGWGWLVAAALWAALGLYVKTSLGVGALSACVVAGALLLVRRGPSAGRAVLLAAAAYVGGVLALGTTLLSSLRDFPRWMSHSFQLASEFSVAMTWIGPRRDLAVALLLLTPLAVMAILRLVRATPARDLALLFACPLFFAFKHGFVRQDVGHELAFFPFVLAAAGFMFVEATSRAERVMTVSAMGIATLASGWLMATNGYLNRAGLVDGLAGARGYANATAWLDLEKARADTVAGRQILAPDHLPGLPPELRNDVVGVVPWEMAYCAANGLRCAPNPTLQLYAAYTAELDRATAEHYAAADAPPFLIAEYVTLDGRNPVLDTPATWRAIAANYRPRADQPVPGRLLLERREHAAAAGPAPVELARAELAPGAWASLPSTSQRLSVEIDLNLSLWGRIAKLLFRVPPVYLEVVDCAGAATSHRVPPDVLRNGAPLSALPVNHAELRQMLEGTLVKQPTRMRIAGPGAAYYARPIVARVFAEGEGDAVAPSTCQDAGLPTSGMARQEAPAGAPIFFVDELGDVSAPLERSPAGVAFAQETQGLLTVRGWAIDPAEKRGAAAILITVDGAPFTVPCGTPRPDVAAHFGEPGYRDAGCTGSLLIEGVGPGDHVLQFGVVSRDRSVIYEAPQTLRLSLR